MKREGLEAQLRYAAGAFTLEIDLEVHTGVSQVILGRSGAGKSTCLRLLAGILRPAGGRVVLNGTVYADGRLHLPPAERSIGYVFQEGRLFPHMSALENVAFPLRAAGTSAGQARRQAYEWLERLGLSERAGCRPAQLSGGEAQRVALARALVREPQMLLLDEPLAALDVHTRSSVRGELLGLLRDRPRVTVLVTHDYVDAAVFGDRVQVLEAGMVVQAGTVSELMRRPRTAYVAQLCGMNVWKGEASAAPGGATELVVGGYRFLGYGEVDGPAFLAVSPSHVTLHRSRPDGSARNLLEGTVTELIPLPDRVRVTVSCRGVTVTAEVTSQSVTELELLPGRTVFAAFKTSEATIYA